MPSPTLPTTRAAAPSWRDQNGCEEVGGIKAESALVRGIRAAWWQIANQTKDANRVSLTIRIFVPMTRSSTLDVESPVAVTISDNGAGSRDVMLRWLYNPPSIWISAIELRPMLTPISGSAGGVLPGLTRVLDAPAVVEAGFDEQPAGADGFRILCDERTLLRRRRDRLQASCSITSQSLCLGYQPQWTWLVMSSFAQNRYADPQRAQNVDEHGRPVRR